MREIRSPLDGIWSPFAARAAQAAALSGARTLVQYEAEALAIDFTDNYFYSTTSLYGSAYVKDTGTPANNYDSTPYGLLTYTSPSLKMTRGPDGLLRFGAHNLYLNSASPANQSITVVSGATYAVIITGNVSVTASGAATGTWTVGTNTFTAATTTLTLGSTSGAGTVHLRRTPSDSTYLATTTAARYALPFEWDASGNLQGILVEEARTNVLTYSEQFGNAAWTKTNATVTADDTTAPDGQSTADKILETTATGAHELAYPSNSVTSGTAYTASIFVKGGLGRDYIRIAGSTTQLGGASGEAWYNISTGAVGTVDGGTTASIVAYANGWYRCIWTRTAGATGTPSIFFSIANADNSVSYTGDAAKGLYVWGAQFELGSFPTSYIPTLGSTVTRAVDNITLATSNFPWVDQPDTLFAGWKVGVVNRNGTVVSLDKGAPSTDRTTIQQIASGNTFRASARSGGASPYTIDGGGTQTLGNVVKAASAVATNDIAFYVGGSLVGTDASAAIATGLTTLRIGNYDGSQDLLNGHIQKIILLPRRVSNADLQTLTGTGVLPAP